MKNINNKENTKFKILTSDGFKDFKGIKRTYSKIIISLYFKSGNNISGSPGHLVKLINNQFKPLSEININEIIYPDEEVISIKKSVGKKKALYDIQGIEGNEYLTNNIVSHNCAFVPENIFQAFYSSVYPTISSGTETKIIMVSTPNGLNHYYELWNDAVNKRNNYVPFEVNWYDVPGRTDEWAKNTIKDIGQLRFDQEFGNEFFGRASTIIPAPLLKTLNYRTPISSTDEMKIFELPQTNAIYVGIADVAEGVSGDYSVFTIIKLPANDKEKYEVVFTFRSNTIDIFKFTEIVHTIHLKYNECFLLIEINMMNIAESLYRDFECDNILKTTTTKQKLTTAFYHGPSKFGIKTTEVIKKVGLEKFIQILEEQKININDIEYIRELSTLVKGKKTFQAKSGSNDDCAMTLILFAWIITQEGFRELYNSEDYSKKLNNEYLKSIYDQLPEFYVEDGITRNF